MGARRTGETSVNRILQLAIGIGLALSACGPDDHLTVGDAGSDDGNTLTSYVIDLINNHTSDPTPRPYSEFSSLPDPDGDTNNTAAYGSLFP
jgi:hypothetical protein